MGAGRLNPLFKMSLTKMGATSRHTAEHLFFPALPFRGRACILKHARGPARTRGPAQALKLAQVALGPGTWAHLRAGWF